MNYRFHPEAQEEFTGAIDYYESCGEGLGCDFAVEVYSALKRTASFPDAWPCLDQGIRRSLVKRFPFGIIYSVLREEIFVLAIMHLHRDPEYWRQRVIENPHHA